MTRRELLAAGGAMGLPAGEIRREVFLPSPGKGTAVMAYAYETDKTGKQMRSIEQRWSRSDTIDLSFVRTSKDWGETWSKPELRVTGSKRIGGTWRQHPRGWWFDREAGKLIEFWMEGVLPNDDPLEGMRQWRIYYRIDGKTVPLIADGQTVANWLPGVTIGRNSAMLGDQASRPLPVRGGFLLPIQISLVDAQGHLTNPGGGYTYHDAAVLHARWQNNELRWRMSEVVRGDPARSTRGLPEGTLAHLNRNRILMVMRGSNDRKPELPSYRWYSVSSDGGWSWSAAQPWTYDDGTSFFSPSACSQLLPHSSGRLYWLGNITAENPRGNRPRYPFVLGEVDLNTGLLRKTSLRTIDDLRPGENPQLTLSNFYAREDARSREICLHMTRLLALASGWEGDAMLYRIPV